MPKIITLKDNGVPKNKQIVESIIKAIQNGEIKLNDKLPSINSIRQRFAVSRDTVLSAYNVLKMRGIIQSVAGKGYYLVNDNIKVEQKIFLLFDELNPFKEYLYNSFLKKLDKNIDVDIFFHHFNFDVFRNTILNNKGKYSKYIIMPANLKNTSSVLQHLNKEQVIILDQLPKDLNGYCTIYQNFAKGISNGLKSMVSRIAKYQSINLVFDSNKQPIGILNGFTSFCVECNISYNVYKSTHQLNIEKEKVYMTLDDASLISIIKEAKSKQLIIGADIGIIAYNETPLKEVIANGITSISTDFKKMGEILKDLVYNKNILSIENDCNVHLRNSL